MNLMPVRANYTTRWRIPDQTKKCCPLRSSCEARMLISTPRAAKIRNATSPVALYNQIWGNTCK